MQGLGSWNQFLKISNKRPVPPVFLEYKVPYSPPWTPFRASQRSTAAAAQSSIPAEADGKCPCLFRHWQMPLACASLWLTGRSIPVGRTSDNVGWNGEGVCRDLWRNLEQTVSIHSSDNHLWSAIQCQRLINKPRSLASGIEIWGTCVEKCWTVVVEVGLEKYGKTSQWWKVNLNYVIMIKEHEKKVQRECCQNLNSLCTNAKEIWRQSDGEEGKEKSGFIPLPGKEGT